MALLLDEDRLRYACNPFTNRHWMKAAQTTTGTDEQFLADAFADGNAVDLHAQALREVLELPLEEFAKKVPDLRVARIPKREAWETEIEQETGLWVEGEDPTEMRRICINDASGKSLSSVMADMLTDTCDWQLPSCAIAYRPGRRHVVRDTLIEVASAVGFDGHRCWAKLDVRDAFNRLPRPAIRQALEGIGFEDHVAGLIVARISAKQMKKVRGRWIQQPAYRGSPAGLQESSILINVFFLTFDEMMQDRSPKLRYWRYSDDFLFLGKNREDVERAVRDLLKWLRPHGLQLKGVSPDLRISTLVHDIQEKPLEYLGAEIHADGDIHMPERVREKQLKKLRYMLDLAALRQRVSEETDELPEVEPVVAGVSRYAGGRTSAGSRGIDTYDWEDIQRSILGFYDYWLDLNTVDAEAFLALCQHVLHLDAQAGQGPFVTRKLWVAALGHSGGMAGRGPNGPGHAGHSEDLTDWVLEVAPAIADAASGTGSGGESSLDSGEEHSCFDLEEEEETYPGRVPDLGGGTDPRGGLVNSPGEGDLGTWRNTGSDGRTGTDELSDSEAPGGGVTVDGDSDAGDSRGCSTPTTPSCPGGRAYRLNPASPGGREARGHEAATPRAGGPPSPGSKKTRIVFLLHRRIGDDRGVVGVQEHIVDGPDARTEKPLVREFSEIQAESAVVEMIEHRLGMADADDDVVIAMRSSWLVKQLLQRARDFRSTGLFQRVLELHRQHPEALIVGPCRVPATLEHEVEALVRGASVGRAGAT